MVNERENFLIPQWLFISQRKKVNKQTTEEQIERMHQKWQTHLFTLPQWGQ